MTDKLFVHNPSLLSFFFLMRSIKIRPHELQLDKCAVRDLGVIGA